MSENDLPKQDLPKRKQIRLQKYDYAANGAYFVTVCTKDRKKLLWKVGATCGRPPNGNIHLTAYGLIIDNEINMLHTRYGGVIRVDQYIIMPNHIHLILVLQNEVGGRPQVRPYDITCHAAI